MNRVTASFFLLISLTFSSIAQAVETLKLGVYAYRDAEIVKAEYQPLADYLSAHLKTIQVELSVLDDKQLLKKVQQQQLDLLLIPPSLYEWVRHKNTLNQAIATLRRQYHNQVTASMGGVIVTLSENKAIRHPQDLLEKTVAIPSLSDTGGYHIPLYELKKRNIPTQQIQFTPYGNNDLALQALLTKQVDATFLQTGIVEHWIDEGKARRQDLRILSPNLLVGYPFLASTSLSPEWPFAALSHVSEQNIQTLTVALLQLKGDMPAAKSAQIAGFKPTSNYVSIQILLRSLKLSPYDREEKVSLNQIWQQYRIEILIVGLFLALFIGFYVRIARYNLQLKNQAKKIQDQSQRLSDIVLATRTGTWEWQVQTGEGEINDRWAEILGYTREELLPITLATWQKLVHPKDLAYSNQLWQAHFKGDLDYYECELRMRHKQGHWVWVLGRGRLVKWSKSGLPLRVSGTHQDITEQKHNQLLRDLQFKRDEALLSLPFAAETRQESDFMQYALEQIENLTGSRISFIHFVNPDQKSIELVTWSKETLNTYCHVENLETHYPIEQAGIWVDALHQRAPVIFNDYANAPNKKGLPEGHSHLERFISVPVFEQGKVVMLTGVGNKTEDYNQQDIETVQLISNEIWRLVQRSRNLTQISQQKEEFQRLVDDISSNFVIFSHDPQGKILYISDSVDHIFGLSKQAALGAYWHEQIAWLEADKTRATENYQQLAHKKTQSAEFALRFTHPNGQIKTIKVTEHANFTPSGILRSIDGLIEDITEELIAQQALKRAASVFEHAIEGIMITDHRLKVININQAFNQMTGYSETELQGRMPIMLKPQKEAHMNYKNMWMALKDKGFWTGEMWHQRKDGTPFYSRMAISAIHNQQDEIEQFIVLFSDITEQKRHQQKLEKLAHFDPLTNLPNRTLLIERLNLSMSQVTRHGSSIAIAFLDLDGFKAVNDTYGHEAGDALLCEISRRLQQRLREVDTVARLGGDEFILVLDHIDHQASLEMILERILEDIATPVDYQGYALEVSASLGITFYPQSKALDAEQLIREADQAMYQAKLQGKNRYTFFNHHRLA